MNITTNHAGANIIVVEQNENTVFMKVDLRDSTSAWFYWNFAVEGAEGKQITFDFLDDEVIGRFGPAKSTDFESWEYLQDDCSFGATSFTYKFKPNENKVFFCFSLPYQYSHFERFYNDIKDSSIVNCYTLGKTDKGKSDVPLVVIGKEDAKKDIVFSCRNHSCESVASYVLQGVMLYIINNYSKFTGYKFHIVPFVDLDGVEGGDQGKGRYPHDHNRDYIDTPIYQTVNAWMAYVKKLKVQVGIDFHCPWKWGGQNDHVALIKGLIELNEDIEKFADILKKVNIEDKTENKITYEGKYDVLPGQDWLPKIPNPTASNFYGKSGAKIAFTIEIPYFGLEVMHTQKNTIAFGSNIAKSIELFLGSNQFKTQII